MIRKTMVVALFALTGVCFAQNPVSTVPAATARPPAPAPAPAAPKLSDAAHARIRDVQLRLSQLQVQYDSLQQQLQRLQETYTTANKELNEAIDAAYKEGGLKKEDFTLDINTLELKATPKPEPAKSPAAGPAKENPVSSPKTGAATAKP